MSEPTRGAQRAEARARPLWSRLLISGENGVVALLLAGLVILPLAEVVLRKLIHVGITGSSAFVQHFTLLVGVLGGAIAARDRRLLSLSSLPEFLPGRWQAAAHIFSGALGGAISAVLCVAGWQFVQSEPADKMLAYGIPLRAVQIFLPIGFGLVALRLCWH